MTFYVAYTHDKKLIATVDFMSWITNFCQVSEQIAAMRRGLA